MESITFDRAGARKIRAAVADAEAARRGASPDRPVFGPQWVRGPGVIAIRNSSGADRLRGDILQLDPAAPLVRTYAADPDAFLAGDFLFDGLAPPTDLSSRPGLVAFVVLMEPIAAGESGPALVAGVAAVLVNVEQEWHFRADIRCDHPEHLQSYAGGRAEILWKESGTGVVHAAVRFPVDPIVQYDGVLDEDLVGGWSATLSLWSPDAGDVDADTGDDETVFAPFILPAGAIPADTQVSAVWKQQRMCLEVDGRAC
jgi:hypothetical protein